MARRQTISDQQILDAAQALFTEHGLQATTADIAKRAGCSEGSIFRRYATKHELFLASMGIPSPRVALEELMARAGQAPPSEILSNFCELKVGFFLKILPRMHAALGGGLCLDTLSKQGEPPPVHAIRTLSSYIAAEQELGRIAPGPAEPLARMLIGAMHFYAFTEITGTNQMVPYERAAYIAAVVARIVGDVGDAS